MTKQQGINAIDILLDEKIQEFKSSFSVHSRSLFVDEGGELVHSYEFGSHRENLVKKYLENILPDRMGLGSGFIVTSNGKISTQTDIVFYDKTVTPLIKNEYGQRFFPIESVVAIGEVKSVMTASALKDTLRKMAATKALRDYLYKPSYVYCKKEEGLESEYQPEVDERDQIISFLICERFSFDPAEKLQEIVGCYGDALPHRPFCHRHNMVLSLNDGLLTYLHPDGWAWPFPSKIGFKFDCEGTDKIKNIKIDVGLMKHRFIAPIKEDSNEHIRHFTSMLHTALSCVSVLFPDMARYIADREDVFFIDFEQRLK